MDKPYITRIYIDTGYIRLIYGLYTGYLRVIYALSLTGRGIGYFTRFILNKQG
jgi:hypothetical protein